MTGKEEILFLSINNEWLPVACLTDNPITESTEMIPTTTRDNKGWESFVPGVQSASINFDAVLPNNDTGRVDYYKIRQIKRDREYVLWKIKNNANGDVDEGMGLISELSKSSPAGDAIAFNGVITVTSKPDYYIQEDNEPENEFSVGFPYVLPNLTP